MPHYRSPAKLNLFLRVLGKRSDGYHELSTLMQTIDLCDKIEIHFTTGVDRLTCTDPRIPVDDRNLAMKALHLFRGKTGLKFNLHIHLDKRIPAEAGLGGGSSNAATTLWALNDLLERPVSKTQLIEWAEELGSDVPFFLSEGTAMCTGRGEKVEPLASLPMLELWVLKPSQGLATPEIYKRLDLSQIASANPKKLLQNFYQGTPIFTNDLEASAFSVMPSLSVLKQQLLMEGYKNVTMAGSGSALFCFGEAAPKLIDIDCFHTRFFNRPPDRWY